MKYLTYTLMVAFSSSILAETFKDTVHSIEKNIIKFSNGRVAFNDNSVNFSSIKRGNFIEVNLNEAGSILAYKKLKMPSNLIKNIQDNFQYFHESPHYEPTIVSGMDKAIKIFNRSNPYYKRVSECSDRAHVWSHDEFKHSGTKSMKAFVFFTASYIDSVRFKWWFHVAPMYRVKIKNKIQDLVMDFRYTDHPLTVKEWTDQFVYTKRPCKVTTKFSEYDVNPQTENCYLIFESMHYKIPDEIHAQEISNQYKTETTEDELKASFKYAFKK